jgi:hypothetical protein
MVLTQCTGFYAIAQPAPKAISPGAAPPGWEPTNPTDPFTAVNVGGVECNRLRIGPLERGPVRFVWAGHGNADIPDSCGRTNRTALTTPHVLNVFVINDRDIAGYLKEQYGMPAIYGSVDVAAQGAGSLVQRTWSWTPEGQGKSELTLVDDGTLEPYDDADRFWWPHGDGIAQLDFDYTRNGVTITDRPAYGTMVAPSLPPPPDGNFLGTAIYFSSLSGEGKVTFFSDRLCEHPVPT